MAAFVKKADLCHNRKGRFHSIKEINHRAKLKKVWNERLPQDSQDLGFGNVYKTMSQGSRVVELDLLAKSLDSGCKTCAEQLNLSNITDDTLSGRGSFL